ncbi:MAG: MaoC/PaaZ C-terminal domain-containing protein [Bacteroidota bacterium]
MNKIIAAIRFIFRQRLKISSDVIDTEIKDFNYLLTNESVSNYNEVVANIPADLKTKGLHPLYYTKISWKIIENLNNYLEVPIEDKILKTIVHQSEHIIFNNEAEINSDLTVKSKIWSIKPHKKGTKMLIRFEYYSGNELVATEYSGGLLFGVKCIGKGQSLGQIPQTDKIEGSAIWKDTIEIDEKLPYTYAKKAEIDAPIHTNPKFAKSIGLPDIILQGTCTFAKTVNLIVSKELENDLNQIKSVSAKFTGMVIPPNFITVRLLKKDKKILYFDVLNKKGEAVIKGGQIKFVTLI